MHSFLIYLIFIAAPLFCVLAVYITIHNRKTRRAVNRWQEAQQNGLTEPASMHPLIDPNLCLGCGTCVQACPEGEILGLINRKAQLVSPSSCIGHGACREACPTDAITLVFGTATRGVEIPALSPEFETNVKGIYIAGELGGMGLIKNAIAQGTQAIEAISRRHKKNHNLDYDLVIVGAGPAGVSAALAAKANKLNYIVLEQDSIGGTVSHYPRGKIVMTQPAELPIVGKFQFREASKESLVAFWNKVVTQANLAINTGCRVSAIDTLAPGFQVHTDTKSYATRYILLALGRRGTPRTLDVPGEQLSKVVYRLIDPEQYRNKHVLVVGGGDSALEAALAIAEQPGTHTTLSYRSSAFSRAKAKNRERVDAFRNSGHLEIMLESQVSSITEKSVHIDTTDGTKELENDYIIVCAGGILPTPFLKKTGIHVEEKFGSA